MRKALKASRLMGLCAIVFGLMAIGVTAAEAEPGAFWLVNGQDIGGSLVPIQAENDTSHSTLLTTVGATNVEILCGPTKLVNGLVYSLGQASGKIHYEGCTTKLNGNTASNCKPKSPSATAGLIETNALRGLIQLHKSESGEKDELIKIFPSSGTAFATVELGALCAIGNKFDITGSLFLIDCMLESFISKVKHLYKEGPLSALKFGTNTAKIHGGAWGFLIDINEGSTFAGHAA